MDFSKMTRNDKIEMCFEYIEDHDIITNKTETSASGEAQARASIKQNMKRNKSPIFNAMVDALVTALCDKREYVGKHGKMRREKDREIENLELRLSDVDNRMKVLETTIKEQNEMIKLMKINLAMD
jgi:hypothetical protein